jgi:hypothetical protein
MSKRVLTIDAPAALGRDINTALFRTVDAFDSRSYFSGSDVRFEFDGIVVEEIAGISYKLLEPVQYYYSYASRTRVKTSRGSRLVQGSILTNFKDPSQIYHLLKRIRNNNTPDDQGIDPQSRQDVFNAIAGGNLSIQSRDSLLGAQSEKNLSKIRSFEGKPNPGAIQAFRDALWGRKGAKSDLYLTEKEATYKPRFDGGEDGFKLRMIFGEPNYQDIDQTGRRLGAVVLISGVEIMGESIEVTENGEPVRVAYDFLAADVN